MARCFLKDSKGNIWIGFEFGGVVVYSIDKKTFVCLGTIDKTFKSGDYWDIKEDARGHIWLGSKNNGLLKIKIDLSKLTLNESPILYKKQFLSNKWITSIFINKDNIPWVGTSDRVYSYNPEQDNFFVQEIIESENHSVYISGIIEDHNDDIWICTTTGLYRYDDSKHQVQVYKSNNDISRVNYQFQILCSQNGTVYLGGINGLTYFYPDFLYTDSLSQNIYISDLKIQNQSVALQSHENINLTNTITLSYKENQIHLEFSSLYLTDPYRIKYSYQLEGLDKDWSYTDANRNYASLSNIPPGKYKFNVRSTNSSGEWVDNIKTINIIISPPFWATWWAYCVYSIILIAIIGIIVYINYMKSIYSQQKKYNLWKTELYSNIITGFETPLFLLKAPLESMIGRLHTITKPEIEELLKIMNQNVKRLRHLVKQLSEIQKIEAKESALTISKVEMINFVLNVHNHFSNIAKNKNIRFNFQYTKESIEAYIDVEKIEIILFNLLSNIFRNTKEGGHITIHCYSNDKSQVWIEIFGSEIYSPSNEASTQDINTLGLLNSANRPSTTKGLGLTLAKDFIELHGGELYVDNVVGKGYTFRFYLPIQSQKKSEIHDYDYSKSYIESYIDIEKDIDINSSAKNSDKATRLLIFLVEKDKELSTLFTQVLRKENYNIKTFGSSDQIFISAINLEPALVLCNLTASNKNEMLFLCKNLKENIQTCHIPILIIMNNDKEDDCLMDIYEAGADVCIVRPFEISYLLIRIKHLVALRESIKEKLRIDESIFSDKEKSTITSIENQFLHKIIKIIDQNIDDVSFNLEEFAKQANISRSVLNTKIQSLVAQTPIEFVRTIRLKKAAQLLETKAYSIAEVSLMVGFTDPGYFSTCFKKRYNESPSEYLKNRKL